MGTTAVKTSLFTLALELVYTTAVEYPLHTHDGLVEVDVEQYWDAICRGVHQLPDDVRARVAVIGLTSQGETLIPMRGGKPLSRGVVWLDARAKKEAAQLARRIPPDVFYRTTGLPDINGAQPICKLLHCKQREPELYGNTEVFLMAEDYILYRLTGEIATEKSLLTSTGYFSLQDDDYNLEWLEELGLDRAKLPRALECGTPVGSLTNAAAKVLGLSRTVVVCTGAMDQTAAALAAGCNSADRMSETTGTALVMTAFTDAPVFNDRHNITIYRHVVGGQYLYLPIGNTAGMALKWLRDNLLTEYREKGYEELDELAVTSPPGSNGLVMLPFLAGCVDPDTLPAASGVFAGLTLGTTRADFCRAVMESVGYLMRDMLTMLEGLGCCPDIILSMGGGSRSVFWQQIKADITGKVFYSLRNAEAASTGAAWLAARGAGLVGSQPPDPMTLCRYDPDEWKQQAYRDGYARYRAVYNAMKPVWSSL